MLNSRATSFTSFGLFRVPPCNRFLMNGMAPSYTTCHSSFCERSLSEDFLQTVKLAKEHWRFHPPSVSFSKGKLVKAAPLKIMFVCLGNICRSPAAEAIFRSKLKHLDATLLSSSAGVASTLSSSFLGDGEKGSHLSSTSSLFSISSCGFGGVDSDFYRTGYNSHDGDGADHRMVDAGRRRGIDFSMCHSKLLQKGDLEHSQIVVAMSPSIRTTIYRAAKYWDDESKIHQHRRNNHLRDNTTSCTSQEDHSFLQLAYHKTVLMRAFDLYTLKSHNIAHHTNSASSTGHDGQLNQTEEVQLAAVEQVGGGKLSNTVPDPYYGGKHGFENVLDMLQKGCDTLHSITIPQPTSAAYQNGSGH